MRSFNHTVFSKPGDLSSHDWFMLAGPMGKYAMHGLLPAAQEQALFDMFDALNFAYRKALTPAMIDQLSTRLAKAAHGIEVAFPITECDIKLHNVTHFAKQIEQAGPLWATAMWPYERNQKHVKAFALKQRAKPELAMINSQVLYARSMWAIGQTGNLSDGGLAAAAASTHELRVPAWVPTHAGLAIRPMGNLNRTTAMTNEDTLAMHVCFASHLAGYRELWQSYVSSPFLAGLLPALPCATPARTRLSERAASAVTLGQLPNEAWVALHGWKTWAAEMQLSRRDCLLARGPQGVEGSKLMLSWAGVSVGGVEFTGTGGTGSLTPLQASPTKAVFMADSSVVGNAAASSPNNTEAVPAFGVLRRVVRVQHPAFHALYGSSEPCIDLAEAAWISTADASSSTTRLGLPVLRDAYANDGRVAFVSLQAVCAERIVLAPMPHGAGNCVVLHRDSGFTAFARRSGKPLPCWRLPTGAGHATS
jgi:hypothetical protein